MRFEVKGNLPARERTGRIDRDRIARSDGAGGFTYEAPNTLIVFPSAMAASEAGCIVAGEIRGEAGDHG